MEILGRGEYATIFQHPAQPNQVVRMSLKSDGWFFYARRIRSVLFTINYGPRMAAMTRLGEAWIAVTDKLNPLSKENLELVPTLKWMIDKDPLLEPKENLQGKLRKTHSDIDWFITAYLKGAGPINDSCFMERDGKIVVNHPFPEMTFSQETFLAEQYKDATV